MTTSTGIKNGYLAKGDAISPTSQGPDEPVVNETTIMTASRFRQIQDANAEIRRFASTAQSHGGFDLAKRGRTFNTAKVAAGTGSTFTVTPAVAEYDTGGTQLAGHCPKRAADTNVNAQPAVSFLLDTASSSLANVPYEASGGTDYNVGLAMSIVPSQSEANPRTGPQYEFVQETAVVGVTATPASVSYNAGLDLTTLTLSGEKLLGDGDSLAGRAAMAWFIDSTTGRPVAETAVAIVFGTITNPSGSNLLVVSGKFGQTTASTTAADYRVCVLGPVVWSSVSVDEDVDGVAHLAYGNNSGGWDADNQRVYPTTYGLLENFVAMLPASDTSPDLVSVPKVSIRPNDNEATSSPQLEVWKNAAGTNIAFRVDKAGNITFDGVLQSTSPASALALGVDDGNQNTIERGLNVFHTYNAGFGADNIGVELGLQVEDESGNRIDVGQISAQAVDATAATIDSVLKLGRVAGSTTYSDVLLTTQGGMVIESGLVNIDDTDYYTRSATSPPALTVLGGGTGPEPLAKVRFWNHDPSDASGGRSTELEFYGTSDNTGANDKIKQATIEADHFGASVDSLSRLNFSVNTGVADETVTRMFTLDGNSAVISAAVDYLTEATGTVVASDIFRNRTSGAQDLLLKVEQGGATGVGEMKFVKLSTGTKGVGNILRTTYAIEDGTSTLDVGQIDAVYLSGTAASLELKALTGGSLDRYIEINGDEDYVAVLSAGALVPFNSTNTPGVTLSPFQIIHSSSVAARGLDIANDDQNNTDDTRETIISALGRLASGSGGTRHRLGGIRFAHDDPANGANYWGKVELFVNTSSGDPDEVGEVATFTKKGRFDARNVQKAWARFTGSAAASNYGISSITDDGSGDYTVNFDDPFSTNDYAVQLTLEVASPGDKNISYHSRLAGSVQVRIENDAGTGQTGVPFSVAVSGTVATP